MFGSKRRRAASNPPLNGNTANFAATTAASQAFLKNRSSNASLSSAAAAAALKARPMTPTSVADVQTRRTIKRSGSTSSVGSSYGGSQRSATPQLERRGSSGSMSERTFREPSPGPSRPVPSAIDAPPVPAIPQHIRTDSHRRAASMEAPPQRVASPISRNPAGRGSSLGPQGSAVAAARRSDQRSSLSSVAELTSVEQRRGSVNFSYPTGSRPGSPVQKRLTSPSPSRQNPPRINSPSNQSLVYDPHTRSFIPAVTVHAIQQNINDVASQPVKKKKRPPGTAAGSHLAETTVGGRPKGTAVDAIRAAEKQQQQQQQQPTVQPVQPVQHKQAPRVETPPQSLQVSRVESIFDSSPVSAAPAQKDVSIPKKKKKVVAKSDTSGDEGPHLYNSSDNDSDAIVTSARKGQFLAKKPSIVREDPEREEQEDDTPQRAKPELLVSRSRQDDRSISPSPLPKSKASKAHHDELAPQQTTTTRETPRSVSQPTLITEHNKLAQPSNINPNGSIRGARVSSMSPGRSAHFAATPDNLMVKHQPPPRSISPIKSALKHSNSRTSSPMPTNVSETSGSPNGMDEQIVPRKKAVRVSFDERNVVVGEAAPPVSNDSPIAPSPQVSKRPWYSIARGKKKDAVSTDDEEDEIMKPRPALPSFGSVRERKNREVEERPLVKPADPTESKTGVRSPILPSPVAEVNENPLGQSNDHVVGAIIAQDSQNRNAANISKSREPLPPQVTSVEGSGYHSDTDSSVSGGNTSTPATIVTEPEVVKSANGNPSTNENVVSTITPSVEDVSPPSDTEDVPTPTQEQTTAPIPQIAISLPTPTPDESEKKKEWLDIPGSWDDTTSDSENETSKGVESETFAPTPAVAGIAEPTPSVLRNASPQIESQHIYSSIIEELPEESEAEVFSDAAEELTDSDHEGFQSLNAAVDSPITTVAMKLPDPPESPTTKSTRQNPKPEDGAKTDGSWNQAQSYWSSLSADKRKQLELDAMRDAESSDTEVEVKPVPKPKKKKKKVVQQEAPLTASSERTYMIKPGSKADSAGNTTMRSSMRTEPPPPLNVDTGMRRSMRGPNQGSMRDSMRSSNERNTMQTRNRPVSLPAETRAEITTNKHARNLSSASAAAASNGFKQPAQPVQPALRRKKSSDSESSFKRARPSGERRMMGTMRTNNNSVEQQASSRFSVRSLSPTESVTRRPFGGFAAAQTNDIPSMRSSMRGSVGATPTMRGSAGRAKSPSGGSMKLNFGFGSKTTKPQKVSKSGSGSRFADSSDEEDSRPSFRSRFNDSSDDSDGDVPAPRSGALGRTLRASAPAPSQPPISTPVRGIPRRADTEDMDSSDLPDSDDDKFTPNGQAKLSKKRQTNGTSQGATLASGSIRRSGSGRGTITTVSAPPLTRPPQKRRGSIMSILRRKKDDTSKVRKSDAESPARRDTPLERSKSDLLAIKNDGVTHTPLHSPKLQKRNPMSRENSYVPTSPVSPSQFTGLTADNAPIISTTPAGNDGRPFTSDGANGFSSSAEAKEMGFANGNGNGSALKPGLGTRRYTADALGSSASAVGGVNIVGGSGVGVDGKKKKKFGTLRRMFGLHD